MTLATADLTAFAAVTDMERARTFYESTLGLRIVRADDYGCMLDSHGTTLRLALVDHLDPPPYTVLGWGVPSISDAVRALVAAGVVMHRYPDMDQDALGIWTSPSGDRVAWFPDSEGNTLSVTEQA